MYDIYLIFNLLCFLDERVGNLSVVLNSSEYVPSVKSQFTLIIRGMYSNPPSHGARIVSYVLSNSDLYDQWYVCLYSKKRCFVVI